MPLHTRLQQVRESKGLTVLALHRLSRISRQTIYSIERTPDYRPSIQVLRTLADALEVEVHDLLVTRIASKPERVA